MLIALIAACEIGFWLFLGAGLTCRYLLRRPRLGLALLACAPLVDLVLLVATTLDLRDGGEAGLAHGLAAVYIGTSVGFGHSMVRWADERFAHRFADGPPPVKRYGAEHAAHQRAMWFRHLLAWTVGCALLGLGVLLVDDWDRTTALVGTGALWLKVLVIDFLISFSYTIWPRQPRGTSAAAGSTSSTGSGTESTSGSRRAASATASATARVT